jgi:hypothetical protein
MGFCPRANDVGSGLLGRRRGGRRPNWCIGFCPRCCRAPSRQRAARGEASKGLRRCRPMHAKHADGTGSAAAAAPAAGFGSAISAVKRRTGPRPIRVFCVHHPASALSLTRFAACRTVPRIDAWGSGSTSTMSASEPPGRRICGGRRRREARSTNRSSGASRDVAPLVRLGWSVRHVQGAAFRAARSRRRQPAPSAPPQWRTDRPEARR